MPAWSASSTWSALSTFATWPISSITSTAVSWSTGWLIVAMTPMLSIVFMTSLDFTAMLLGELCDGDGLPDRDLMLHGLGRKLEAVLAVRADGRRAPPRFGARAAFLVAR